MNVLSGALPGMQSFMALEDGNLITGTQQDCTAILEDAKGRHNAGMFGSSEMKHAARIPLVAIETYCNANGIDFAEFMHDPKHIRVMCNDPDLRDFRIWPGRI